MYIPPQCSFAQKKNITKSTHGPNLVDQKSICSEKTPQLATNNSSVIDHTQQNIVDTISKIGKSYF